MNQATKETTDEIRVEDLEVDQERKREEDPRSIEEKIAARASEPTNSHADNFATTAELVEAVIYNINDRPFPLPNQPAGVFAAISREANGFIEVIRKAFDKSQIGAMEILQKGAESFGAEGKIADEVERDALETVTKKTLPAIMGILAQEAPEFMAKVVAMILEPDPDKIRKGEDLTFSTEEILWKFPVDQQVAAVGFYIESLNLGALQKKVRSFRQA